MYHHSFLFAVVSSNNKIEEALRGIEPLEDCDYTFCTVRTAEAAEEYSRRTDTAFIYDLMGGSKALTEKDEKEELIFVAGSGDPVFANREAVAAASEIWVMPENGAYDDALLGIYFERLTNRMKKNADARKQKICFETLINSVPDISWFKDTDGAHLIVNDSFCETVGKTKEQIYKKGHCYIWDASKEDEKVCLDSDRIIMESRKTNTFEESIKKGNDIRLLKSFKSALLDVDGEIFGTCGIAHDITELRNMGNEIDIVLNNIPFAVLVEDKQSIVLNKNSRFDAYFPEFVDIVGKSSKIWKDSLNRKQLLGDTLMEVVIQSDDDKSVLVLDEEPVRDVFGRDSGKIVTLTDITMEYSISKYHEREANTDYLTGLNNRRSLMDRLVEIYTRDDITLVMIDLDNFKNVNDNFGHEAGDRALIKTAELMQECFKDAFCSRMGGDEFMILVCGRELDEVRCDVERLMEMMRSEYRQKKEFSCITASIGIVSTAVIPEQKRSVSELIQTVDSLLYEAKKSGKDCCCVYGVERQAL